MPKKSPDNGRKRLILLDSHAILHRAYHALPDFASAKGEPTGALYGLCTMLIKIIADLKPDYIIACYDLPGPTYRHEVYKEYKAGRKKTDSELVSQLKRSRDIFTAFNIPIYDKPGFEADDMLGTIVEKILSGSTTGKGKAKKTSDEFAHLDVVIASGDMDTMQLITDKKVRVYTLKKGINDTIIYDEEAVINRFGFGPHLLPDYKGLRGDPSDNIIGIAGIGEKTATMLITAFGTIENIYSALKKSSKEKPPYDAFKKVGITDRMIKLLEEGKEEAEFSKMLATIRRDAPIDFSLPEKPFKEGIDMAKISALFKELDFRTLGSRLSQVLTGKVSNIQRPVVMTGEGSDSQANFSLQMTAGPGSGDDENKSASGSKPLTIDAMEFRKTGIALWLLNSNLTDPTLDDMYNFARVSGTEAAETAEGDSFKKVQGIIFAELDKRGLRKVYETIELPLIPVIDRMKKTGMKIDVDYLKRLSKEYHATANGLEKQIWKLAGMEFNINSPKQLGEVLFDKLGLKIKNAKKTGGGARSTKESELLKLKDEQPIVAMILDYRELQKLLGTYIDTIPTLVDADNRLHSTLVQTGSTTGRMSSQDPNLQNIPIKTELGKRIRQAFIADKKSGFVLASFDYSQIELRVAAFLSGDKRLIEIFKSGGDIHRAVAAEVFHIAPDKVDPEMRRRAKVINFGVMYGMGVNALRANLGTDRAEAQKFYNEYFETFSGLAAYLNRIKAEAARNGYTETFFGRRRYFEGIKSKVSFIRAMAERMAINAPIQGTEADIVKLAMIKVDDYIEREGLRDDARMLLQVHDEILFELRKDKAEKISKDIKKIMEDVIDPKDVSGVRCVAEYETGDNWSDI